MNDTILVIDDNPEILLNIAEILKLANYQVHAAENGKLGLEYAKKCKPDLILCDVNMPVLDGFGVLLAIENIPELISIPFVFLSKHSELSDIRHAMDMGADDYLTKPFSGEELLHVVNARLKKTRLMRDSLAGGHQHLDDFLLDAKKHPEINFSSEHLKNKKLKKRNMLFIEGDAPAYLYFIKSGKIKVFKSNDQGKEFIINILKEGDYTGYVALIEDNKHHVSAMAIEDAEVTLIPKEDFFQLLYTNNEMAIKFVKLISHNFSETREKLLKLAYDSARKRVSEAILYVYQKYMGEGKNEMSFSLLRENISALSGISCESVSRNLTDFREEGLIETHNGIIKILDIKKLENLKN